MIKARIGLLLAISHTMIPRAAGFLSKVGRRSHLPKNEGRAFISTTVDPVVLGMTRGEGETRGGGELPEDEFPLFPPSSSNGTPLGQPQPPDKGQLYSDDELWDLLKVHEGLSEQMGEKDSVVLPGEATPEPGLPSLHDLVLQTVQEMDKEESSSDPMDAELKKKVDNIIAIASDVDGTLLSSTQSLHPRTEQAIRQAVKEAQSPSTNNLQFFFPATGKTRKGALDSLGPEVRELVSSLPGVFIQGLYCVDGRGQVLFEQKLIASAIEQAEALGQSKGVTLLAYDGDNLYSNPDGDPALVAEIHEKWGEPRPSIIPVLADHANGFHKILLVHSDADRLTAHVRPDLQSLSDDNEATVTQAIPTMLELLPQGCSKALGVEKLCQALGIDPRQQLLAIGDAENDVEMLELAAIGVAVNNACGMAKEAADVVLEESNDQGGAGAAMEQFSPLGR